MNISVWKKDWQTIQKQFPDWQLIYHLGVPSRIEGNLILFQEGIYVGDYDIQIIIPKNYPNGFPMVIETSNKIPRIADRHIYIQNGTCCVEITHKQEMIAKKGILISTFIRKYIIPYFLNDIFFTNNGGYANGEYKHGFEGHLQFYQEQLGTNDIFAIFNCLMHLHKKSKLAGHAPCCCGSQKAFKKCHQTAIASLKNISDELLLSDIQIIFNSFNK